MTASGLSDIWAECERGIEDEIIRSTRPKPATIGHAFGNLVAVRAGDAFIPFGRGSKSNPGVCAAGAEKRGAFDLCRNREADWVYGHPK